MYEVYAFIKIFPEVLVDEIYCRKSKEMNVRPAVHDVIGVYLELAFAVSSIQNMSDTKSFHATNAFCRVTEK